MKNLIKKLKALCIYAVGCKCKKDRRQRTICYLKTEKRNNDQPTHKTAHLQAPTHKPILQLAKELFSCRHITEI